MMHPRSVRVPGCMAGTALLTALLLAGCTVPDEPVALKPLQAADVGLGDMRAPAIAGDWWQAFGDPQLDRIVADALAGNPQLDLALARVRASQARVATAHSGRLPQAAVDGSVQLQRLSKAYIIPPPYGGSTKWMGDVQAGLGWNVDFWGRQAAAIDMAEAEAGAVLVDREAARLAISGAVVQTYVELARAEQQAKMAVLLVERHREFADLMRVRVDSDLESDAAVRLADARLASARQLQLRAQALESLLRHALALLAGQGADYHDRILATSLKLDALPNLPRTLPADLLSRRPDILGARLRIRSASAGRQVARRAFYPNVNLLGLVGLQALGIDNLFGGDAVTAGAGAAIHLPIFEGGRLKAGYAAATAGVDAAIASYNQLVLEAVRETADTLRETERLAADVGQQSRAIAALRDVRNFSTARHAAGLDTRLDIIRADMELLASRQQMIDLQADQAVARVRLLLALGGGQEVLAQPETVDIGEAS